MARGRQKFAPGVMPLFPVEGGWEAPREPPNLDGLKVMAIDTETHDPELETFGPGFLRNRASLVGVSLAAEDNNWYFPIDHLTGNCTWDVKRWLQDQLSYDRTHVFANAHYDAESLDSAGIHPAGNWIDVLVDQCLLDEEFEPGYSLDAVAKYHLNVGKADDVLLSHAVHYGAQSAKQAKQMMRYLPASAVGVYASLDAQRTLDIHWAQSIEIDKQNLNQIVDLERQVTPLLWQMRKNGIRFNRGAAEELGARWLKDEEALLMKIIGSGFKVDPWSAKSIGRYCDYMKLSYPRTDLGNPSFTADFFDKRQKDPVMSAIGEYRKKNKMRRDFIEKWLVHSSYDGRIHARWHQTASEEGGTRTGRLASSDPNMQQVPGRDPYYGPVMRALFLPEEGERYLKADYSGQEIRIAIHYANLLKCTGVQEIVRMYKDDPHFDFYTGIAKMAYIDRGPAKTLSLGTLYGMGIEKTRYQLGVGADEAARISSEYFRIAPYLKELAEKAAERASNLGYVRTHCGRRRRFKDKSYTHKACNAIVQGTAADMVKVAMVSIFEEIGRVSLLQVHDELGYSIRDEEEAMAIQELMEAALVLTVPTIADINLGETW